MKTTFVANISEMILWPFQAK